MSYLIRHIYVLRFIRIHCALHLTFIKKTDTKLLISIPNVLYSSMVRRHLRDRNPALENANI